MPCSPSVPRSSKETLMCGNTICKERSEEERMMSKSLRMLMETVAFQTALDYSNTTPDLVTLTRHFGQQKKQDAAPGETAKAHGAELGEHSEQHGKKPDHGDSHGSNVRAPGRGWPVVPFPERGCVPGCIWASVQRPSTGNRHHRPSEAWCDSPGRVPVVRAVKNS